MKKSRLFSVALFVISGWLFPRPAGAAPSLPVTKLPVLDATILTGPPADPASTNGQWFSNYEFQQSSRTHEFYDNVAGGAKGAGAITGYVSSVTYQAGVGSPIVAFSIQATIWNDSSVEAEYAAGDNSHGESLAYLGAPYEGALLNTRLVAEFALIDEFNPPPSTQAPYRDVQPYILADNEEEVAWYCWAQEDPNHEIKGSYYVPSWNFGDIPLGQSSAKQLDFTIPAPGLPPTDPRYAAIVLSMANQSDLLANRSTSLKISTWLEDLVGDSGVPYPEAPHRSSNVSVFHDIEEPTLDFGDAPDSAQWPMYPTLLVNNGARHIAVPGVFMGLLLDVELDGQPTLAANGDDLVNLDDEDGVTFVSLITPGAVATVQVVCSVSGYLSAWVDFNADGDWSDAGETIAAGAAMNPGPNLVAFPVPPGAAQGLTYARFRFYTAAGAINYSGLQSDGEVEDYRVLVGDEETTLDFGDAPDPSFPTLYVNNGARHVAVPGIFMGGLVDVEMDGQPTVPADGDDVNPLIGPDDEDGVLFGALVAGSVATVQVACSVAGTVSAWVDFNADGDWNDAGENIFAGQSVPAGINLMTFTVPASAKIGTTYSRFRFYTKQGAINYYGLEADGEVEDYLVAIEEPEQLLDLGDAPDSSISPLYPTLLVNNGARHVIVAGIYLGLSVDSELDGQPTAPADGDDVNPPAGSDDEDGVTFQGPFYVGQSTDVVVNCSVAGILAVWVDFNTNGTWGDFGENVAGGIAVTQGINYVTINVPASASVGNTYARFRFTTLPVAMNYTGLINDGEVEDYLVTIEKREEPTMDFGDAMDGPAVSVYPTLLVNNGARHTVAPGVYLGFSVDMEPDGQPTVNTDGDDVNPPAGLDDEDGVTLPAVFIAGATTTVSVTASVAGFLNAWIDWNNNVSWADPGEQVFVNTPLTAGLNTLSIVVPPVVTPGGPPSRWRFTTAAIPGLSFVGLAPDGEVEDHEARLEMLDFGDSPDPAYPTLLANNGARHRMPSGYWLGQFIDADPGGRPTATADGDDLDNLDDADGVVGGSPLVRGVLVPTSIAASTNGFLDGWIDFNQDGDWADAGEQVAASTVMVKGTNSVFFLVPAGANLGPTFCRLRFSSVGGLSYTGLASDGEVEDYRVEVYQQGPSTNMVITNLFRSANTATIRWNAESGVIYEAQALTNRLNDTNAVWLPVGSWVTGPANSQADTNALDRMKCYRVIAPWVP